MLNEWEMRYRRGDTGWDRGDVTPALLHWLDDGALANGSVLVPGCGRGYEVVALARLGFDVIAIDIAPSAVAALNRQLDDAGVSATVICGDLFDYQPSAPVDAVFEQTCLCAIEPGQREAYQEALHRWLKPGGTLLALFMQTDAPDGPPFHCDLQQMRLLFDSERWQWPQELPFRVERNSRRYELGFVLVRK